MKTVELLEAVGQPRAALKQQRLQALLTPENIASHYDRVLELLTAKLTLDDINEFAAKLTGKELDKDDLRFELELMLKKLSAETEASLSPLANVIKGIIPGIKQPLPGYHQGGRAEPTAFYLSYGKGKWTVSLYNIGFKVINHKHFDADKPVEALTYVLNLLKKAQS